MAKAKILVVEDEAITASDLQNMLQDLGYDAPAIAASGEGAIKKAEEIKPDLILMDIILKGMGGIEAAEQIRDRFDIPVVYVTAYRDEERLEKTKVSGPYGYIIKPFGDKDLRPVIEMALQRHTLEKALRESEEFSSSLLNNSPNPIIVINPDTSVRYVNHALERLTGFPSAELIGSKAPYPWWTEETLQKTYVDLDKTMREGVYKLKELFQKKDGTRFWVAITSTPIKSDGELKYYLANWTDITGRKEAEKRLSESETRFRELFDNMSSGVAVYEAKEGGNDFVFNDFNQAAETIDSIKKEDLLGKSVLEVFPGVIDFGLFEVFQRVWHTGKPEHHPISFYKDDRIAGWCENYVYKLPSGEIVAVYDLTLWVL